MTDASRADRSAYQKAYYEANKDRLKANRKPQRRTEANIAAEARYREKKRLLKEIADLPIGGNVYNL